QGQLASGCRFHCIGNDPAKRSEEAIAMYASIVTRAVERKHGSGSRIMMPPRPLLAGCLAAAFISLVVTPHAVRGAISFVQNIGTNQTKTVGTTTDVTVPPSGV